MAAAGGIIFSARSSSVDLNAGGGTILLDAIAAAVVTRSQLRPR
jgi:ribose/xylose/arabinose/galactoside ABC-type transport system permease subunit